MENKFQENISNQQEQLTTSNNVTPSLTSPNPEPPKTEPKPTPISQIEVIPPQTIKTEKGNFTKINDNQLIENIGNLSISELLHRKLQEIQNDPQQQRLFDLLGKEQKEQYLIESVVTSYTKIHHLKNPYEEKQSETKTEGTTKHLAANSQGETKVNSELGIIEQSNNIDQYKIVEEKTDGTIQIRNTSTIDSTITNQSPEQNQTQPLQYNNSELTQSQTNPYYQKPTELNQEHTLKRTLKPNQYYSNNRAAFIDLKMLITLLSSSLFIGWVIGKIIAYL